MTLLEAYEKCRSKLLAGADLALAYAEGKRMTLQRQGYRGEEPLFRMTLVDE